jgi:hypothetical protein
MERHIVDAVRILNHCIDLQNGGCHDINAFFGRQKLYRAIRYLANPDRFIRPKRGPSNVKVGKRRANKRFGPFGWCLCRLMNSR